MKTVTFLKTECRLEFGKYPQGGRNYLLLIDAETGEEVCRASVNLPDAKLAENQIAIKDWSENVGMLKILVDAGIVKDIGFRSPSSTGART